MSEEYIKLQVRLEYDPPERGYEDYYDLGIHDEPNYKIREVFEDKYGKKRYHITRALYLILYNKDRRGTKNILPLFEDIFKVKGKETANINTERYKAMSDMLPKTLLAKKGPDGKHKINDKDIIDWLNKVKDFLDNKKRKNKKEPIDFD